MQAADDCLEVPEVFQSRDRTHLILLFVMTFDNDDKIGICKPIFECHEGFQAKSIIQPPFIA
jgi:hypothetical protein